MSFLFDCIVPTCCFKLPHSAAPSRFTAGMAVSSSSASEADAGGKPVEEVQRTGWQVIKPE
jgi:hypothetical protein